MNSTHRSSFASGLLVAAIALTTGFQMPEPQMHPVEIDGMARPAVSPTMILRTDYTRYAPGEVVIDETLYLPNTSAACGFDVFEHDEGQLKFQVLETAAGTLRFKDLAVQVSQAIIAPSQGTRVDLQPGGRGGHVFLVRPDGSDLRRVTDLAAGPSVTGQDGTPGRTGDPSWGPAAD